MSVGEEAGERLPQAADGLSFHLILAKAGPGRGWLWKVEGIGQRLGFARERQGGGGMGGRGGRGKRGRERNTMLPQAQPQPCPSDPGAVPVTFPPPSMGLDPDGFSRVEEL